MMDRTKLSSCICPPAPIPATFEKLDYLLFREDDKMRKKYRRVFALPSKRQQAINAMIFGEDSELGQLFP